MRVGVRQGGAARTRRPGLAAAQRADRKAESERRDGDNCSPARVALPFRHRGLAEEAHAQISNK